MRHHHLFVDRVQLISFVLMPPSWSYTSKGHIEVIRALVAQGGPSILDIQDTDGRSGCLFARRILADILKKLAASFWRVILLFY